MSNVISLAPTPMGFANADMSRRLRAIADTIDSGELGDIATVVVIVETKKGETGTYSQGVSDACRIVGLMNYACHALMDYKGDD